jgi:hypothetical protein
MAAAKIKNKPKPHLVKVDPDILEQVKKHLEPTGAQIGKYYDNAVAKQLDADRKTLKRNF